MEAVVAAEEVVAVAAAAAVAEVAAEVAEVAEVAVAEVAEAAVEAVAEAAVEAEAAAEAEVAEVVVEAAEAEAEAEDHPGRVDHGQPRRDRAASPVAAVLLEQAARLVVLHALGRGRRRHWSSSRTPSSAPDRSR